MLAKTTKELMKKCNEAMDTTLKSMFSVQDFMDLDDETRDQLKTSMELLTETELYAVELAEELDRIESKLDMLLEIKAKEIKES